MHVFVYAYMRVMIKIMSDTAFSPRLPLLVLSAEQWGIFKEFWLLKCLLVSEVVGEFAVCLFLKAGLGRARKYSWPIIMFWGALLLHFFIKSFWNVLKIPTIGLLISTCLLVILSSEKMHYQDCLKIRLQLSSFLYVVLLCQRCVRFVIYKKVLIVEGGHH